MPNDSEPHSHGRRASLARAYPASARWFSGGLVALSRASLPAIALAVWWRLSEPFPLPVLIAILAAHSALPAAAAWLLERAFTGSAEVREGMLHLRGRGMRLEVPCESIARVEPWRIPLPGAGIWLRLRSGARLPVGLEAPDLTPLLAALAETGGVASAGAALRDPFLVYAAARARRPRGLLSHPILKFPGFSLLPTAVLFNAHQHIAYGGSLGQYYSEGLAAWLLTFAGYWAYVCTYLVLFASVCRAFAEGVALLAARAGSAPAARVRRTVEIVCGVLYYAGVPALVLARFLL